MSYKHIIFDLDGTLIDSAPDIIKSLKLAFKVSGINLDENSFTKIDQIQIGPPLLELIYKIEPTLSKEDQKNVVENFKKNYDETDFSQTKLYSDVFDVFEKIKLQKKKSYLATLKRLDPTLKIVKEKKIGPFQEILCHDSFPNKSLTKFQMLEHVLHKWEIKKESALMVGDSVSDIEAAHQNGIDAMAFCGGYGKILELKLAKPKFLIHNFKNLLSLMSS
jgi:phosphoglycolate phosphatase